MKVTIRKAASNSARLDRQTNVLHLSDKVPAKNIEISEENSGKNIFSICLKKMTVSYCSIMNRQEVKERRRSSKKGIFVSLSEGKLKANKPQLGERSGKRMISLNGSSNVKDISLGKIKPDLAIDDGKYYSLSLAGSIRKADSSVRQQSGQKQKINSKRSTDYKNTPFSQQFSVINNDSFYVSSAFHRENLLRINTVNRNSLPMKCNKLKLNQSQNQSVAIPEKTLQNTDLIITDVVRQPQYLPSSNSVSFQLSFSPSHKVSYSPHQEISFSPAQQDSQQQKEVHHQVQMQKRKTKEPLRLQINTARQPKQIRQIYKQPKGYNQSIVFNRYQSKHIKTVESFDCPFETPNRSTKLEAEFNIVSPIYDLRTPQKKQFVSGVGYRLGDYANTVITDQITQPRNEQNDESIVIEKVAFFKTHSKQNSKNKNVLNQLQINDSMPPHTLRKRTDPCASPSIYKTSVPKRQRTSESYIFFQPK